MARRWTGVGPASPHGGGTEHDRGTADRIRSRLRRRAAPISKHRPVRIGQWDRGSSWNDADEQRSLAPASSRDLVLETRRILQGDRLRLRPLASTDLRRCVKWFSDPQIIHFLGRNSPVTLSEEERWFRDYERRTDEQIFAIEAEGTHIGNIGLHKIDRVHRKAEVGIVIGEPTFWSKGYGTEAMRTALRYAFGPLSLNKVSLDVLEYNTRAIRTYERLGFRPEGVHREDIYKDGRFVHVIRMSILARELSDVPIP
ncbi:MAG: GNAT family N-acetyltransferase [Methanobacteriota archaeon]|nr:MAG: GNAT family N-acetyltransferase [Euryarchaeota archaeon]